MAEKHVLDIKSASGGVLLELSRQADVLLEGIPGVMRRLGWTMNGGGIIRG